MIVKMDTVLVMPNGETKPLPPKEPEIAQIVPIKHPTQPYVRPVQVANIEGKRRFNRHRNW